MHRRWKLLLLLASILLLAIPGSFRWLLLKWETNPILAGQQLARENGCWTCHLPYGSKELGNPGSRWGTVPRFRAGNAMMYAADVGEIEEFISHGAPLSWLADSKIRQRLERQPIRMPAYGDHFSSGELSDLVAYVAAEEALIQPGGDEASAGRTLALRHGCLSCHGVEGSGGQPNPGSMGGFIPGFLGKNFTDLVRNEQEFQEWVRTGTLKRLESNSVAAFFFRRQKLSMPAYGEALDEVELQQLWAWVKATRSYYSSRKDPIRNQP